MVYALRLNAARSRFSDVPEIDEPVQELLEASVEPGSRSAQDLTHLASMAPPRR